MPTHHGPDGDASPPEVHVRRRMGGGLPSGGVPRRSSVDEQGSGARDSSPESSGGPQPPRRRLGAPAGESSAVSGEVVPEAAAPRRLSGATEAGGFPAAAAEVPRRMGGSPASANEGRRRMGEVPAEPATEQPQTPATEAPRPAPERPSTERPTSGAEGTPSASRWRRWAFMSVAVIAAGLIGVVAARWARSTPGVEQFLAEYPGHSALMKEDAPTGIPAWVGWQHFLNMFFMVLIVRTGLQIRLERRPPGYWTPNPGSFFSPKGNTPKKISLAQWLHQCLDVLWVANGLVFITLLFATGHWMRIVPTSWEIFPNMVSAAVQYASLDWPTENGWTYYNALQLVAYFLTVFVAAPLAALSGLRMSTWWPASVKGANRYFPIELARALHYPVMVYFAAFTMVHVLLVFLTGALNNLNHMYTSRNVVDWLGLVVFLGSLLVIVAAWFLTKPVFTTPLAAKMGKVSK